MLLWCEPSVGVVLVCGRLVLGLVLLVACSHDGTRLQWCCLQEKPWPRVVAMSEVKSISGRSISLAPMAKPKEPITSYTVDFFLVFVKY
eukprot:6212360-Pleurochrysis_carterae.AAC.4